MGHDGGASRAPFDETDADADAYTAILRRAHADEGLHALAARVQGDVDDDGVVFHSEAGPSRFLVDLVPRIVQGDEWDRLAAGLSQRVEALERFVADVYGEREIVAEGVIPAAIVDRAEYHEPELRGVPVGTWMTVAGLDVVRGDDGELKVLEDNLRTPSGLAYAMAARTAVQRRIAVPQGRGLRPLDGAPAVLLDALRGAALDGAPDDPHVVLLTDGERNSAYYEHEFLAAAMDIPLVTPDLLEARGDRVRHDGRAIDVVYRRTDSDRFADAGILRAPLRAGTLAVVNAFGTGVADDKLVHSYVEDMVRFYLGEEPDLRSVASYDLSDPRALEEALDRLDELVVKPCAGYGGQGVVIGPHAEPHELAELRDKVAADPRGYVAQDVVMLSSHPTVCDGELAPRHVDLRPFVLSAPGRRTVLPGGLTRVALDEGNLVVNSSMNGGAKDTWVLD